MMMRHRGSLVLTVLVTTLVLVALAHRSHAALGCATVSDDVQTGGLPNQFQAATCDVDADCGPVGSMDCSAPGFCYCPQGPLAPFCACLTTTAPAPVVSHSALTSLALLLCLIGLGQLWRRGTNRPNA